jgi:hypothetical protein
VKKSVGKMSDEKLFMKSVAEAKKIVKNGAVNMPRVIPVPKKIGGVLPLIPIFSGLAALGALGASVSQAYKNYKEAKKTISDSNETKRHNMAMEKIAVGRGLYLKPYKKGGYGLHLNPFPKNR